MCVLDDQAAGPARETGWTKTGPLADAEEAERHHRRLRSACGVAVVVTAFEPDDGVNSPSPRGLVKSFTGSSPSTTTAAGAPAWTAAARPAAASRAGRARAARPGMTDEPVCPPAPALSPNLGRTATVPGARSRYEAAAPGAGRGDRPGALDRLTGPGPGPAGSGMIGG